MKILLTGATGLIGKELGKKLVEKGHTIAVVTRDVASARATLPYPADFYEWKSPKDEFPRAALADVEAVIHLAGENIGEGRWTEERKRRILESRVLGTRAVVQAIATAPTVHHFIGASAIGIYEKDFLKEVCRKWEAETVPLKSLGVRVVNLRTGVVLSRYGGALEKMLPVFMSNLGAPLGSGKQAMSWIHIEDIARLYVHCLENESVTGPIDGVAPNCVSNKEFSRELALALGKWFMVIPVPGLLLKLLLGEMSTLVLDGAYVTAEKAQASGFNWTYPDLKSALANLCGPFRTGDTELLAEQWVPKQREEIFPFFCDETNLERLTPGFLNFHVVKKSTPTIQDGTLIDYKLRVRGLPMRWRSRIEDWRPFERFVDTQLKGPYSKWHHTHEFIPFAGGTLMRDRVRYKVPLGSLGQLIMGPLIKSDVTSIFTFRRKAIRDLLHP